MMVKVQLPQQHLDISDLTKEFVKISIIQFVKPCKLIAACVIVSTNKLRLSNVGSLLKASINAYLF